MWSSNSVDPKILETRVVLIFKRDKASDIKNYRPISLTNAMYKIYTSRVHKRLEEVRDQVLQGVQYGFRKQKSTAHAILIIRRLLTMVERDLRNHFIFHQWIGKMRLIKLVWKA